MTVGWRPHDLAKAYSPFAHSVGCQVGRSDPVFMAKFGREPIVDERPKHPYMPDEMDAAFAAGDEKVSDALWCDKLRGPARYATHARDMRLVLTNGQCR